ncbi:hypothetical protein DAPPUDRAFT_255895 [Daphnia pulex]|uniref:Uncharacterized protein n=1 Tax=Daphnia pulex TaxID=6669 RepID=E9HAB3_DAPPU|nr:hypothetical protein DAPPUDRAFT_255895 [Daphnia pulex]|eukprot:EFX71323.1 hypothetical protein DAPPUDRAFT_255895 [Daphnia pulex]
MKTSSTSVTFLELQLTFANRYSDPLVPQAVRSPWKNNKQGPDLRPKIPGGQNLPLLVVLQSIQDASRIMEKE